MSQSRSKSQPNTPTGVDPELLRPALQKQLHERMRVAALQVLYQMFEEEVQALCGKRYSRSVGDGPRRAGSDRGSVFWAGQKVSVKKPRVKQGGKELHLQSYQLLQDPNLLLPYVQQALLSGVSTRKYATTLDPIPGGQCLSSSSVSRAFKRASRKALNGHYIYAIMAFDLGRCFFPVKCCVDFLVVCFM